MAIIAILLLASLSACGPMTLVARDHVVLEAATDAAIEVNAVAGCPLIGAFRRGTKREWRGRLPPAGIIRVKVGDPGYSPSGRRNAGLTTWFRRRAHIVVRSADVQRVVYIHEILHALGHRGHSACPGVMCSTASYVWRPETIAWVRGLCGAE